MKQSELKVDKNTTVAVTRIHTLVIGSGAAGLNAAVQLRNQGVEDVLILTEGLKMGTSINTGSDKQTYYKSAMCGNDLDAPLAMAKNFFLPGSMHGDLALIEASVSGRGFLNLVNLGVKFPQDSFALLQTRAQMLLGLAAICLTITGFSGPRMAQSNIHSRFFIGFGLSFVLFSVVALVAGPLRLRWMIAWKAEDVEQTLILHLRQRTLRTKFYRVAMVLLLIGLTGYLLSLVFYLSTVE